jgi:translocation and assembly module TamA
LRKNSIMRCTLVLAIALAACSRGHAHKPGDEWVKKIDIEGNKKLSDGTLRDGLALHRAQKRDLPPDPYLVQVDADRIRGEYLRRGYLDIDVRSRVERAGDAATIVYSVDEGPRAKTRVVINGIPNDPDLPVAKVREQLPLADGEPFDYAKYELAKEPLMHVVEDAGYAHAKLDATVYADRANRVAVVQLDYTTGPKCKFGTIEISGVDGELADAVRGRVQFSEGDLYSTTALAKTQRALYAMNRFSTVQVQPIDSDDNPVVGVKIAVSEGARREIRLGGGFGLDPTAYEVRGRAGYTIAGWPFDMDTVTVDLRPAYALLRDGSGFEPRMRALALLERQDLLWTYSKGEVEAGFNYLTYEAYTSYGPRGRLGFSTPILTPRVQLRLGWGIQRVDFRKISPLIDPGLAMSLGLDRPEQIGFFQQAMVVDLRNHPIEPTFGAYAEVRANEGTRAAGSDYDYVQIVPELRGFLPVGPVVLAGRVRAGNIYGDVPVTERFFSGGAQNHRGFGERKLSPYVMGEVDGDNRYVPYGGAAMLETGIEARIPLTTWRKIGIGSVVFLDGGDVAEERSQIDPMNLYWAAGVGLRFKTIVGPVRTDLGYRINRTGPMDASPGSHFAFHLSLGEAF